MTVILALYKDEDPKDYSAPTIVVANSKNHSGAAVVRTYYDKTLDKAKMVTTIKGPICSSDLQGIGGPLQSVEGCGGARHTCIKDRRGFRLLGRLELAVSRYLSKELDVAFVQQQGGGDDHV